MPLALRRWRSAVSPQTQQRVAIEVLRLAADTRKAYVAVVAAEETVRYMRQVQEAADAGAELARRMAQAGNWSKLSRAREQGFYADAALYVARAEQAQSGAASTTRLMGLWGEQAGYVLPERLPDLPGQRRRAPQHRTPGDGATTRRAGGVLETEALAKTSG